MRVGVDARHLGGGRGVAHYTAEALAALAERFPGDEWRAFVPRAGLSGAAGRSGADGRSGAAPAGGAAGRSGAAGAGGFATVGHPLPSRALFGAAALLGRPRLDRLLGGGVDVVWIPAPAPVAISPGVPYVLTVHDLSWVERPRDFTPYERAWHRLARAERLAAGARVVVAVSGATRDAISRRWRSVDPSRIRVVHPGIPTLPEPAARPEWLPARYVLAVGALEPRKAPELLAEAFETARAQGLDADLVFAGEGRLAKRLAGRRGIHIVPRPDRPTIAALYEHALALALPSHDEGFGMTPLEAARARTPAIVSDLPVFGETLGDRVLRVPPGDVAAWARALLEADSLSPPSAPSQFTWQRTAEGLHAAFTEAAA